MGEFFVVTLGEADRAVFSSNRSSKELLLWLPSLQIVVSSITVMANTPCSLEIVVSFMTVINTPPPAAAITTSRLWTARHRFVCECVVMGHSLEATGLVQTVRTQVAAKHSSQGVRMQG